MSWFGYGGSGRRSGGTPNFVMITKAYGPAFAPYPGQVEKMNKGGDKVLLSGGILEVSVDLTVSLTSPHFPCC